MKSNLETLYNVYKGVIEALESCDVNCVLWERITSNAPFKETFPMTLIRLSQEVEREIAKCFYTNEDDVYKFSLKVLVAFYESDSFDTFKNNLKNKGN